MPRGASAVIFASGWMLRIPLRSETYLEANATSTLGASGRAASSARAVNELCLDKH